ncbi:MAG: hypothetical protein ABIQ51_21935 [Mesorhizobium sp.]
MTAADRHRMKLDIERRAAAPSNERPRKCSAIGCQRFTQRSNGKGLSEVKCKQHVEFRRRHGSTWMKSYSAARLAPYRKAAHRWLRDHGEDPHVVRVIAALDALIADSGRAETANRARWKTPDGKARIALARLREAGKRGEQLLAITLTVKATISVTGPRGDPEFMQVQIAKMVHRLASGTHIKSAIWGDTSKYPRPEGRVMRILGHRVEDIAGIVAGGETIDEVIAIANGAAAG